MGTLRFQLSLHLFMAVVTSSYRGLQSQSDAECLKQFKQSVKDPQNYLQNWFTDGKNATNLCDFMGVTCLHQNDSNVYELLLSGAGLEGTFPSGLNSCNSLTKLDLSENKFSGPIPEDICAKLPFLVTLDLHQNMITGTIPRNLANCSFFNNLDLSRNRLTGTIPGEIGLLNRLKRLDVSGNQLSGKIPYTFANFTALSFQGNSRLCGAPLAKNCSGKKSKKSTVLIAGLAAGGVLALVAAAAVCMWFLPVRVRPVKGGTVSKDENKWLKRIRAPHSVAVSMFDKPLAKLSLVDLMAATKNFSAENVIGSGRTGIIYKATIPDGTELAIKRLKVSAHTEEQFRAETETVGKLRHRNLVPMLGYCVADSERLLVYEFMPNGSVKERLHGDGKSSLDWLTRLKIAIGACRGLAWLHHSCNPKIIHRNISASSLLLDKNMDARITDFGLARMMNSADTHISTFVNGDFGDVGYVAPEYIRTLVATAKGDIYSMGVVLLELITGQKAVDVDDKEFKGNLVEWVEIQWKNGKALQAIDASLLVGGVRNDDVAILVGEEEEEEEEEGKAAKAKGIEGEMMQFMKIALSCVNSTAKERPSAYEIFHMLRSIGEKYELSNENDVLSVVEVDYSNTN